MYDWVLFNGDDHPIGVFNDQELLFHCVKATYQKSEIKTNRQYVDYIEWVNEDADRVLYAKRVRHYNQTGPL